MSLKRFRFLRSVRSNRTTTLPLRGLSSREMILDREWNPPLSSDRLRLSPLTPEDAAELVVVLSDPSLYRFMGGAPPKLEELQHRYRMLATRRSPDGEELWLNWVIRDRHTQNALGTLEATVRVGESSVAHIAWVLGTNAQGNGYASESARALTRFLVDRGMKQVMAYIHPDHTASNRVAAAIGMEQTQIWQQKERAWQLRPESLG